MSARSLEPVVTGKPGRPPTGNHAISFKVSDDAHAWLRDLAAWANRRDHLKPGEPSPSVQAKAELALWRGAREAELARITLTIKQACCLGDVLNGHPGHNAIATGIGIAYAECFDAFRLARSGPVPDLSSYGAKWGPEGSNPQAWEDDLLRVLSGLGPVADWVLRDAIARWWEEDQPATAEGFAAVGLRVTGGSA